MKQISLMIFVALFFLVHTIEAAGVTTEPDAPQIYADSAILVEASTGRVIFEKNADQLRQPASLTKMMTGILGWEYFSPSDEIEVSSNAAYTEYSCLRLEPGDRTNALDLLAGTIIVSDNAGAVAVAERIAGNVSAFSVMMNNKAREIGCENTNFVNPHGLPDSRNVSTARDLAKIAMYGMRNAKFRETVGTKKRMLYWLYPAGKSEPCENTNELLYPPSETKDFITVHYNPAEITGIKTGYTQVAGGCLAASAKRGDVELIVIVLHSADMHTRFNDAAKLLNYGFDKVRMSHQVRRERMSRIAFVRGGERATVHLTAMNDLTFPLIEGEDPKKLSVTYELPKFIDAGIEKGQVVGKAILNYAGKPVASVPMIARESVAEGFSISSMLVGFTEPFFLLAENFLASA